LLHFEKKRNSTVPVGLGRCQTDKIGFCSKAARIFTPAWYSVNIARIHDVVAQAASRASVLRLKG
jgi:hypothetical protein